jgi:flagellar basal-body rod protein FlgC
MGIFTSLRISASGLTAERLRMDVISNNIANSQTIRTAEGAPYQRQRVIFRPNGSQTAGTAGNGVIVAGIIADDRPGNVVHDPDHPDADAQGDVTYPNVDIATEMVDLMSARRAYQANIVALQAAKEMAARALQISEG